MHVLPNHSSKKSKSTESLSHDLLRDTSIGLNDNIFNLERRLDRSGLLIDPVELFERSALGLNTVSDQQVLRRRSNGGAYQKIYHITDSKTSQPTKTQIYL